MAEDSLNIFYAEPNPDRWIKFDRYPRKIIRRIIRGQQRPGGQALVAINLMRGLKKIGVSYRFNDFRYIKKHPHEIACVVGKPHLVFERQWANPIIFGASIYSHPVECPDLFKRYPNIKRVLVPGEWMRRMFEPWYHDKVQTWPVGIDTEVWSPAIKTAPEFDFLIYDKIRWEHDRFRHELIDPVCRTLEQQKLSFQIIRYGTYEPLDLLDKLKKSKACIFLCEHETQGLAYQQILATGTPILAWDRGGYWQDPYYYPNKVKYQPVSSVPYWDDRCGLKFIDREYFVTALTDFLSRSELFKPREYIMENLTLEQCAKHYFSIYQQVRTELSDQ